MVIKLNVTMGLEKMGHVLKDTIETQKGYCYLCMYWFV